MEKVHGLERRSNLYSYLLQMRKDQIKDILWDMAYLRPEEAEFIYDYLVKLPQKGTLLELGTGLGHSTVFFAKVLPEWKIYSVDAYGTAGKEPLIYHLENGYDAPGLAAVKEYIASHNVDNVELIVSSFQELEWNKKLDALYIDGTHYYEDVKEDFEKFSPFLRKGGIVIFDDYNLNWGVKDFIDKELSKKWEIVSTNTTAVIWKKPSKKSKN